jgi:hypothetical protein
MHPGALATAPAAPPVTAATATTAHDDDPNGTAERAHLVESLNELDLDRLTRRLWSRMRRELRGELLIDRERAGALADMR